jgi:hypothetical protein
MQHPYSGLKNNPREKTPEIAVFFMLVSCLAYFSTVNTEATCSFETSVGFQRTIRRCIPEDKPLRAVFMLRLRLIFTVVRNLTRQRMSFRKYVNLCRVQFSTLIVTPLTGLSNFLNLKSKTARESGSVVATRFARKPTSRP